MQVVLDTQMKTFNGCVIKEGESDLLLRSVLLGALTRGGKVEQSFDVKARQFALGVKIAVCKDSVIDLDSGEIQTLKDLVNLAFPALIVGQVGLLLEGKQTGLDCDAIVTT